MPKTEVYSWRVSQAVKSRLEETARRERRSVAALLDDVVTGHLEARGREFEADEARQRELHARAARLAGCLTGSDRSRSAQVRRKVRSRLRVRHGRG